MSKRAKRKVQHVEIGGVKYPYFYGLFAKNDYFKDLKKQPQDKEMDLIEQLKSHYYAIKDGIKKTKSKLTLPEYDEFVQMVDEDSEYIMDQLNKCLEHFTIKVDLEKN